MVVHIVIVYIEKKEGVWVGINLHDGDVARLDVDLLDLGGIDISTY